MINKTYALFKQHRLLRYAFSGGITYGVEIGGFFVLYYGLHLPSGIANAIGYTIALVVNYTLAHFIIFDDTNTAIHRSMTRYLLLAGFNLLASSLLISLLVDHIGMPATIAKPCLSVLVAIWTYFGFKYFVFRQPHASETALH